VHDRDGAQKLLGGPAYFVFQLKSSQAEAADRGKELAEWCEWHGSGWDLESVERGPGGRAFSVQPLPLGRGAQFRLLDSKLAPGGGL
jgi:hypothetical protein